MKRYIAAVVLALAAGMILQGAPAYADELKIQPTLYKDSLAKGARKKGYVDISNSGPTPIVAHFSVEAFRQIDDKGSLAFQKSEQIAAGIRLDLESVKMASKDVVRLYFVIDGAALPEGDVFAVIFAQTEPKPVSKTASGLSARVGTLLAIRNGTPASHQAEVTALDASWLQIGEAITLDTTLKNPAPEGQATGFFPEIVVDYSPYNSRKVAGPLVFAGRSRAVTIRDQSNLFGPVLLRVSTGDSSKTRLIFAVTGYWRWAAPLGLLVVLAIGVIVRTVVIRRRNA